MSSKTIEAPCSGRLQHGYGFVTFFSIRPFKIVRTAPAAQAHSSALQSLLRLIDDMRPVNQTVSTSESPRPHTVRTGSHGKGAHVSLHSMEVEEDHVYTRVDPSEVHHTCNVLRLLCLHTQDGHQTGWKSPNARDIHCLRVHVSEHRFFSRQVLRSYSTLSMQRTQCAVSD